MLGRPDTFPGAIIDNSHSALQSDGMAGQGADYCPIPSVLATADAARVGRLRLRVESTNLLILGAAAAVIGLGRMFGGDTSSSLVPGLTIPVAVVLLAVVMSRRSSRIGSRGRRIGYTAAAVVSVVAIPWILFAASVIGVLPLLAAGFVVFGWRERCRRLWVTAAVGAMLGLITAPEPVRLMLPLHMIGDPTAAGVVTASFGVIALALGVLSYLAESEELARVG
ncbi:Integral membrane protein [Prescottella defluvii]